MELIKLQKRLLIPFIIFIVLVMIMMLIMTTRLFGLTGSFSGKITQVGWNSLSIRDEITKSTVKIGVSNKTNITTGRVIPYLFKDNSSTLKFGDLKVGMNITGSAKNGEAITLNDPSISYVLSGKIIEIKDKIILIQQLNHNLPAAELIKKGVGITPQKKDYNVALTGATEISSSAPPASLNGNPAPPNPKPIKYTLKDLKKGKQVNIYTTDDVNKKTQITALRIEPISETNPPLLPTQTLPSGAPAQSNVLPLPVQNNIAP